MSKQGAMSEPGEGGVQTRTGRVANEGERVVASALDKSKNADVTGGIEKLKQIFSPEELSQMHLGGVLEKLDRVGPDGIVETSDRLFDGGNFRDELNRTRGEAAVADGIADEQTRSKRLKALSRVADDVVKFHEKGHVHADVKPENVFMNEDGEGSLADFDLVSKEFTAETNGTADYAGAIHNRAEVDTRLKDISALMEMTVESYFPGIPKKNTFVERKIADKTNKLSEADRALLQSVIDAKNADRELSVKINESIKVGKKVLSYFPEKPYFGVTRLIKGMVADWFSPARITKSALKDKKAVKPFDDFMGQLVKMRGDAAGAA